MPTVRRAEVRDIPAIERLLLQVDMVHHRGRPDLFRGPAVKYDAPALVSLLRDENTAVFVCENDSGAVVGHAFCELQSEAGNAVLHPVRTLYIDDICVDELHRRQGVGKLLYETVLQYAAEQNCYHVTLNVWACNPGAEAFYKALGMGVMKTTLETVLPAANETE